MTKNSMLMQTPYFSVVEGFRQFVRDSVRTEKDHYRWVNLYGEKGLDDPKTQQSEQKTEIQNKYCILSFRKTHSLTVFRSNQRIRK